MLMYSKNCASESVNEARKMMFTHGLKSLENIPPIQHALFQHAKRSLFTAAFMETVSCPKIRKSLNRVNQIKSNQKYLLRNDFIAVIGNRNA